jgi:hypothetical protein
MVAGRKSEDRRVVIRYLLLVIRFKAAADLFPQVIREATHFNIGPYE